MCLQSTLPHFGILSKKKHYKKIRSEDGHGEQFLIKLRENEIIDRS